MSNNDWYFRQFIFEVGDFIDDSVGFTYFRVKLADEEECLVGKVPHPSSPRFLNLNDFFGYGLMLPDLILNQGRYRYALVLNDWEYLDSKFKWCKV